MQYKRRVDKLSLVPETQLKSGVWPGAQRQLSGGHKGGFLLSSFHLIADYTLVGFIQQAADVNTIHVSPLFKCSTRAVLVSQVWCQ